MRRLVVWLAVSVPILLLVAAASFGPGLRSSLPRTSGGTGSIFAAPPADAATVPPAQYGANLDTPSATPGASSTPSAVSPIRTVQIGAYNDAAVASGGAWSADQNLGGWSRLGLGPHSGGTYRSYLRFLVAGLPLGVQIDSARLVLTPLEGGTRSVKIEADYVQDEWDESSITWNEQPLSTYQTGAATWQPGNMRPIIMDVTPAVQQWYVCGGTSNNGLLLSADLSQDWLGLGSRKSDTPPVLEVTYQTAVGPTYCSSPANTSVNLAAPSGPTSSTTGAQIGAVDVNAVNNPNAFALGTPIGALQPARSSSGSNSTSATAAAGFTGPGALGSGLIGGTTNSPFTGPLGSSGGSTGGGGGNSGGTNTGNTVATQVPVVVPTTTIP